MWEQYPCHRTGWTGILISGLFSGDKYTQRGPRDSRNASMRPCMACISRVINVSLSTIYTLGVRLG